MYINTCTYLKHNDCERCCQGALLPLHIHAGGSLQAPQQHVQWTPFPSLQGWPGTP